jgi:signal transduction histidine kinase
MQYNDINTGGGSMRKGSVIISTAAYLILVLFLFSSVTVLTGRLQQETPENAPGYADLSNFNFSEKLAYISHTSFLYYQNELYTPEDFKLGKATSEPYDFGAAKGRVDPGNYGTYSITLKLPDKGVYGLSSYSAMYSQRLFINGVEYPSNGVPGKTPETTIPQTKHYTVYFTPDEGKAEIVIQFANFSHADYGGIVPLYVGTQEKIMERDAIAQQRVHILVGSTITAFLFFLGMFFFFHKRYAFLWFSLSCFSIGLRMIIVNEKVIMLLIPDLPWKVSISLEYITLALLLFSFLLYINSMYRGAIHKAVLWIFGTLSSLFIAAVLLTPPIIYTGFILWFQFAAIPFGIYVAIALVHNVIRKKDNRHTEHVLIFIGAIVFITLSILDIQIYRSSGQSLAMGLSETGMMVFIFFNMLALDLQFSRTEAELDEARRREKEMQETNQLLDKMGQLKSDFMANISHEMRTPLTIMASYAGLTAMQLRRNATDEKTLDNLDTVKREAIRLAGMVEQLKEAALENERKLSQADVEAGFLLKQAVDFCRPICLKNKNQLSVASDSAEGILHINAESIFQTLINLITNANRHTKEGMIQLKVKGKANETNHDFMVITVSDDGEGISPELMPHLFQRGVSGDGSSGLGLAICKEIIEENGGEIWVENKCKGTTVSFTLPYSKGDAQYE